MKLPIKNIFISFVFFLGIFHISFAGVAGAAFAKIANKVFTNNKFIKVGLSASDSGVGITENSKMLFSNDGIHWSVPEPYSTIKTNWDITSAVSGGDTAEGDKKVYVKVSDGIGNWMIEPMSMTLTYDITPPQISNILPRTNQSDVKVDGAISFTIEDAISGVDPETFLLFVNGVRVTPSVRILTENKLNVTYSPPSSFEFGGIVGVRIRCSDAVGNLLDMEYSFFIEMDPADYGTAFGEFLPWGISENWSPSRPELWTVTSDVEQNLVYQLKEHMFSLPNVLFYEDFNQEVVEEKFMIVDSGDLRGPSNWHLKNGVLADTSNIFSWDEAKSGTVIHTQEGSEWTDYDFSVDMLSTDNDIVGLVFRYVDSSNYYTFSMDSQRNLLELKKTFNGVVTTIAENDTTAYEKNRVYHLRIRVRGSEISVYRDGELILEASDADIETGGVGMYTWANQGSFFDNMLVQSLTGIGINSYDLDEQAAISDHVGESFNALTGLEFSVYDLESYSDFTFEYKAVTFGGDTFAVFRYVDEGNYYIANFPVRNLSGKCALYRVVNGVPERLAASSGSYRPSLGKPDTYAVSANGSSIEISLNGHVVISATDTTFAEGKVGVGSFLRKATFDDVRVY